MNTEQRAGIRRWAEALESGEYEQGVYNLHSRTETADKFCCLGVLCEQEGLRAVAVTDTTSTTFLYEGATCALPVSLIAKYGVKTGSWPLSARPGHTLASLNDSGTSFIEIAQLLRAMYLAEEKENDSNE